MKNILKITIFAFLLISIGSCTNDKNPVAIANGVALRDKSTVPPPAVLLPANDAQVYNITEWDKADYGVETASPGQSYTIIISDHDKDSNFTNAIEYTGIGIAVAPDRNCTLTVKEFNALLNKLPTFQCGQMKIDYRVKSTLGIGENAIIQYSNPILLTVTAYSTAKQILSFAKSSATAITAPKLLSSDFKNENDFEAYLYLEPGDYKFYRPDACGSFASPLVYGGSAGVIVAGNTASSITIVTAGHYLVKANLSATVLSTPTTLAPLSYSVKYIRAFGVFGLAVRSNPGSTNAVPMVDTDNKNIWKITIDLFKGRKIKFKSNDWSAALIGTPPSVPPGIGTTIISTLGSSPTPNTLVEVTGTAGDITVPGTSDGTKQKYDIVIDVSKPRDYTYTLLLNPN